MRKTTIFTGFQPGDEKSNYKDIIRFILLLAVFAGYFLYLSWKYDIVTGGVVAGLTWSFFVLCTPVADAGFLLDFPVRLITGIPMILSEIVVWVIAFLLNLWAVFFASGAYDKSLLTRLLYKILTTPVPYWLIIVVCCMGTFLSIGFADLVYDTIQDRAGEKRKAFAARTILTVFFYLVILTAYYLLLRNLGISFSNIAR